MCLNGSRSEDAWCMEGNKYICVHVHIVFACVYIFVYFMIEKGWRHVCEGEGRGGWVRHLADTAYMENLKCLI